VRELARYIIGQRFPQEEHVGVGDLPGLQAQVLAQGLEVVPWVKWWARAELRRGVAAPCKQVAGLERRQRVSCARCNSDCARRMVDCRERHQNGLAPSLARAVAKLPVRI
jgi:hypothetical protein